MIWINGGFSAAGRESITTQPLHYIATLGHDVALTGCFNCQLGQFKHNSQSIGNQSVVQFNEDQVICETRIFSRHIPMMAIADI